MSQATRFGRIVVVGLCLCGMLLAAGCSSQGVVSGKVLYQGKPVPGGNVSFLLDGARGVMSSPIAEDGSYTIQNVPPGTVKITVETTSVRPPEQGSPAGMSPALAKQYAEFTKKNREKAPQPADPQQAAKRYVPIPVQYSDPDKSNLTYVVKNGKQEHDIDLK
jgi:hypothetical protein